MQVAGALTVEQRLGLAIASDNPYIQFSCAQKTLSHWPKQSQLPLREQQFLTNLLLKVAKESARWKAWMEVFNSYPLRYPALQVALGNALAVAPESAVEAYVSSIRLHSTRLHSTPGESRRHVAECLRAFRGAAKRERCSMLWTCAYQRWSAWRFDLDRPGKYLFDISRSELDYAVVAYATECMGDAGRGQALGAICNELSVLDNRWYASLQDCVTEWNRLLSQFQPYAHAMSAIAAGEDWLTESKIYRPFDESKEVYLKMMFSV